MTAGPIRQKTVVTQAMERIKDLIASGQYKTGDKFPTEHELAEQFQIGRSSIREAMKVFQHLGVLESRVPRGTYICDSANISKEALTWSILLGDNDFYDLLEFRLIMEQQGLWYILVYHKDNQEFKDKVVAKLNSEVEKMEEALKLNDYERRIEADYRFHQHIIAACRNELFNSIYRTLDNLIREEMVTADHDKEYYQTSPDRHKLLIKKIEEGNYDDTLATYRSHIHDSYKIFSNISSEA